MKKTKLAALLLCALLLFTGCVKTENGGEKAPESVGTSENGTAGTTGADLGDDDKSFGEDIESSGAYDGFFEGESTDITVTCIGGTENAYRLEGTTLTFTAVSADSVYAISGTLKGNIVIVIVPIET